MEAEIIIDRRFCGPPQSGNGGYACGLLAGLLAGSLAGVPAGFPAGVVEVTLRRPPPLDRRLAIEGGSGGPLRLVDGEDIIAEAGAAEFELDAPAPPSFAQAEAASRRYTGFECHPFPTCFVCGPERRPGNGLRIFAGRVAGQDLVAAPWIPDASLVADDGTVRPEFIWAALDCPGAFAVVDVLDRPMVLGRMAAKTAHPVSAGEKCVVIGWPIAVDGRKHFAGTALFSQSGDLAGIAKSTWISLDR